VDTAIPLPAKRELHRLASGWPNARRGTVNPMGGVINFLPLAMEGKKAGIHGIVRLTIEILWTDGSDADFSCVSQPNDFHVVSMR
jgi:hypothetical protein